MKSRINFHRGLLRLHADEPVADAYDTFVQAAITDAGGQMTDAWAQPPTTEDRQVPLGVPFDRRHADTAKAVVVTATKRSLERRWWRPRRR